MKIEIYLAMISLLAFSAVFAEENGTETIEPVLISANEGEVIDTETEAEIKAFELPEGAELRIEMLKKSIAERISQGEAIINRTLEYNSSLDVSQLTAIVDELKILLAESESINAANASEAAESFVSIKKEALDLVSEFKILIYTMLPVTMRNEVRLHAQEKSRQAVSHLVDRIQNITKAYKNAFSARVMNHLNYSNPELVENFKNGTITVEELKQEMKNYYNSLDNETRIEIKERLTEAKETLRTRITARVTNVVENAFSRTIARLNLRYENVGELNVTNSSAIQARISARINNTEGLMTRLLDMIGSRLSNRSDSE